MRLKKLGGLHGLVNNAGIYSHVHCWRTDTELSRVTRASTSSAASSV